MPAITVDDTLVLPRIPRPDPTESRARPVTKVVQAHAGTEGAGIPIRRAFPGQLAMSEVDPFLLLDHAGPTMNGPSETKGASWHPHRGFETVTYMLDGEIAHRDTTGGGGVIAEGETQWMTAGGGIQHEELPTERLYKMGGFFHVVQLWVNLPPSLKMTTPRYQSITGESLRLLTSHDGGALIRLIAGDIGGFEGPGVTHTPITYAHVTLAPGAQLAVPWSPEFSAFAYVLAGRGSVGVENRLLAGRRACGVRARRPPRHHRRRPRADARGTAARRAAHPSPDRALRTVRHEQPRRDPPSHRGLPSRTARHHPRRRPRPPQLPVAAGLDLIPDVALERRGTRG